MARGGASGVSLRRAPVASLAMGERRLEGATAHYLSHVLRLRPGDEFTAFDPAAGSEATAVLVAIDREAVTARFGALRRGAVRAPRSVAWIQGLGKGNKIDAVVRDATEIGVSRIVVTATKRSVLRLDAGRRLARRLRWTRIAEQASRQCGRSDAPLIDFASTWEDALESCSDAGARFCLCAEGTEMLGDHLKSALERRASLAFVCGPEGGLDEGEIRAAESRGYTVASLGPLILRTETVAAAVLGAVLIWADSFFDVALIDNMAK